jgi:hypothetical protein
MKSFKEFTQSESTLDQTISPPMMLQMKRIGIRNFAGGQRVALYRNDKFGLEFSVPYDPQNGKLHAIPTATNEEVVSESMPSGVIKQKQRLATLSAQELIAHFSEVAQKQNKSIEQVTRSTAWRHGFGENSGHYWDKIKHLKEENLNEISRSTLKSYFNKALTNTVELKKSGDKTKYDAWLLSKTDPDKSKKLYDKAKEEKAAGEIKAVKRHKYIGKAMWKYAGKRNSVHESAMHQISRIVNGGGENNVMFGNGASAKVHPVTAKAVVDLHSKVNKTNQRKLSELIHSSPKGLEKVAKFAASLAPKKK